jgi:hypothetical protein
MAWHIVVKYNMQYKKLGGWTEGFYTSRALLADAVSDGMRLCQLLAALHGIKAQPQAFSVRLLPTPPATTVARVHKNVSLLGVAPPTPSDDNITDFPTTSLAMQTFNNATVTQVTQWIKGIPDNCTTQGVYTPSPAFAAAFTALKNELVSTVGTPKPWVQRVLDTAQPKIHLTGYTQGGVITIPGNAYLVNDLIRIGRVASPSGRVSEGSNANGVFRVLAVTGDDVSVLIPTPLTSVPVLQASSYAQKQVASFVAIEECTPSGITKHDIGRPTDPQSGKRRKRR